jgi:hypothetical protein
MPRLYNCDLYGNLQTEWMYPYIAENELNADPMFCDRANGDFTLQDDSPCLPQNNDHNVLMGALGEGCVGTDVDQSSSRDLPEGFRLSENYPNPFNPLTTTEYSLPERSHVTVVIYSILGQRVRTLVNRVESAGSYKVTWDGTDSGGKPVAAGVYLCRFKAGNYAETKKMLLLK